MKVSIDWLKELSGIDRIDVPDLGDFVTQKTAEVEHVTDYDEMFSGIVVGEILESKRHPDADNLSVNKVTIGSAVKVIVCGAPNARPGLKTAVATIGACIGDCKIKTTKIRGQMSEGMMCSEKELGLSENHEGIIELSADAVPGASISTYIGLHGIVLDVDNHAITHRPDLWGHIGWARELAASLGQRMTYEYPLEFDHPSTGEYSAEIQDTELCPRYTMVVMENVKVGESPAWLKSRLAACGVRTINNIVDITNYVMMETGEPPHAFDRDKLCGKKIFVRRAKKGETLETLDHVKRELTEDMLVIADREKPIALGGIMGGAATEVSDSTTALVLETAAFQRANIRKTRQVTGLQSEASNRFEKGMYADLTVAAANRMAALIQSVCPGAKVVDSFDMNTLPVTERTLELPIADVCNVTGDRISGDVCEAILTNLGYTVKGNESSLAVSVPFWRMRDTHYRQDLIEDIIRIRGLEKITPRTTHVVLTPPIQNTKRRLERQVKNLLCAFGAFEISSYAFVGAELLEKCGLSADNHIVLKNTLSEHMDRMRQTLVPNLLLAVLKNQHNYNIINIYELGRVYFPVNNSETEERDDLTGVVAPRGDEQPFFMAKARICAVLNKLRVNYQLIPPEEIVALPYHPGRFLNIRVDGKNIGLISEIHPRIADRMEIGRRMGVYTIDFDAMVQAAGKKLHYHEISRYPPVQRDLALLVDKKIRSETVERLIKQAGQAVVRQVELFDAYQGENVPTGKKSLAYRIILQSDDKTLPEEEIHSIMDGVIAALNKEGIVLRA